MKKVLQVAVLIALVLSFSLPVLAQESLETQLFSAVNNSWVDGVRSLLDRGANVNAVDNNGMTPLLSIGSNNRLEIMTLLLDRHANPEVRGVISHNTLLGSAVLSNDSEVIKLLLDHGANIECCVRLQGDWTPLQAAVFYGKLETVKLLLDRGANVNAAAEYGRTSLHLAAFKPLETSRLLVDRGANLESRMENGWTPLWFALESDHPRTDIAGFLLDRGANIDARNSDGQTLLLDAILHAKVERVKFLVDRGANPDVRDSNGRSGRWWSDWFVANPLDDATLKAQREAIGNMLQNGPSRSKELEQTQWKTPQEQFIAYLSALNDTPRDAALREKLGQLVAALPSPPPIPEDARQFAQLAGQRVKMAKNPTDVIVPIALLRKAMEIAPWWGDVYYNLSHALELGGQYAEAARQMNNYLELEPSAADAGEARDHLLVLLKKKEAAQNR